MSYTPKSTYVPTTDEVETGFHEFASRLETEYPGEYEQAPEFADWREAMHGFRRWHREELAKAWTEGFDKGFYRGQILPGDYDASEAGIENPYEVG